MIIKIDKGTILKGQAITPGYYKGSVRKAGPGTTSGDKVDYPITLDFEDPALNQEDRTVDHTFYNCAGKGIGFLVPFMAAIMKKSAKEIADGLERGESIDFDLDKCQGQKIQFKLINENYQGRLINKIESFLPYEFEVPIS